MVADASPTGKIAKVIGYILEKRNGAIICTMDQGIYAMVIRKHSLAVLWEREEEWKKESISALL